MSVAQAPAAIAGAPDTGPSFAARGAVERRADYTTLRRPEMFIVPLLAAAIVSGIERHCPARSGVRVLDAGCGRQPFRTLLEKRGATYVGFDAAPQEGVTLEHVGALDQPLPAALLAGGGFDFILCTEVLEHVADWTAAFANLATLLAPGGRLLLTAPAYYILHEEPHDFFRPTLHTFEFYAQRHALRILEERQLGDAWDLLGTILGSCRFDAVSSSWLDRMLAKTLWRMRNGLFRAIRHGWVRRHARFSGPTYLSNFVVLERPVSTNVTAPRAAV